MKVTRRATVTSGLQLLQSLREGEEPQTGCHHRAHTERRTQECEGGVAEKSFERRRRRHQAPDDKGEMNAADSGRSSPPSCHGPQEKLSSVVLPVDSGLVDCVFL
ncbi:hypothetical protein EYF80_067927 [Liparis tanakae]|uniref:Uncharacterized protein n=1 Tax=Liparis tanakae TaxID=230148 RepID=A0A4Z2DZI0_9TELE|nr:hypothetical protein EYF80_067927 [Liparis tanakae]